MEFRLLGRLEAEHEGRMLVIGRRRERCLLGILLLEANAVVPVERLGELLWDQSPPADTRSSIHTYVSRLRANLAADGAGFGLTRVGGGYRAEVYPERVDALRFRGLAERARGAGDARERSAGLRAALRLWRGPLLADVLDDHLRERLGAPWEEARLSALESAIDAELLCGWDQALISELTALCAEHPYRERFAAALMTALYRRGRQADALDVYARLNRRLRQGLGIDPGHEIRDLHQRILSADAALIPVEPAPTAAARPAAAVLPELPDPHDSAAGQVAVYRTRPGSTREASVVSGRALPPFPTPAGRDGFVGRASELAVLEAAAAAAGRGQPKVVLVEGEAGAGKSSLLARFAGRLDGALVLWAGGDEAELRLPYGVMGQLMASARDPAGGPPGVLAADLSDWVDPLAVGADLVIWLGQCCLDRQLALVVVDDLHWADGPSAQALLFALRRLQADPVLVVVSARPGDLARLGPGWQRFIAGDHRASRVRLGGLNPPEVVALSQALGTGDLPPRAAGRLLAETGGNPLYCRAMLEEFGAAGLDRPGELLSMPRSLAGLTLLRVGALSPPARELVAAASVLGSPCLLAAAASLAGLADPGAALGEAVAAGILTEHLVGAAARMGFTHLLVQRAIYEDLNPARRRQLHQQAGGLVDRYQALRHRVAAAAGPDEGLAAELEQASREAAGLGQLTQAAAWLAQAAAIGDDPEEADRRLLDALEILVTYSEVAEAQTLAARAAAAGPSPRRSRLLGTLDFFAGRSETAGVRLLDAWQAHDPARDAADGAGAAWCLAALCLTSGRIREAIGWGERAAGGTGPDPVRHLALGVLAIALVAAGRPADGLARLAFLPAVPAEVPRGDTDALVLRGVARVLAEEDLDGAVDDLSIATARMRAGVRLRFPSLCLTYLASAESRLGFWDDAMVHAELAASLAHGADRVWEFGLLHYVAVAVPALRGDWDAASAHVRAATEAAEASGDPLTLNMAAMTEAFLAISQGDLERVLRATATVRAAGRTEFLQKLAGCWWRIFEIEALIGLGRLGPAETALAELDAALIPAGPPSALVSAARLHGDLAVATGNHDAAAVALETAWRHAQGLRIPVTVAQLEISDARRLRAAGQPQAAVTRLRSARQRLLTLGARPYAEICDQELAAAGAIAGT